MSYLEFFGTIAGAVAVWLSARANIWNWAIGVINVVLLFFLFYQIQLYPDMFLQVFFLITNVIGWWRWAHPAPEEEDQKHELKISYMNKRDLLLIAIGSAIGTVVLGMFAENLNRLFPEIFKEPTAFPYADSFVMVVSIFATFLMIQKKIESWIMWIAVDIVATVLYFSKDVKFLGLEYLVFCFLASYGLLNWIREHNDYKKVRA
ncbi:nicotinamide riboside transporter PnuC [Pseudochryseolinea flava]|uniref:Nicotinamide riboside transporter PnuC n=2 Tax=Pseudochryseolinea flava TaxID=2059302 RepID=A0A364YBV1_9BACT|nr:nicotinamide riboside transporter PnuC [Pseudochryseolinea flava]